MSAHFHTTQWTLVLQAADLGTDAGLAALDQLCRDYWEPLYVFVRSLGRSHEDAQDLTQAFFQQMIAGDRHASIDRDRVRFRTWLLCSLKNFTIGEHRRDTAQKRGGGAVALPLDEAEGEMANHDSPDRAFERKWAHTVLARAMQHLEEDCGSHGHADRYRVLRPFILSASETGGRVEQAHADEIGLTLSAARVALSRLRQRYRELLRAEVERLVADPDEVDDEINHLIQALSA